jgi:hypothetical protein
MNSTSDQPTTLTFLQLCEALRSRDEHTTGMNLKGAGIVEDYRYITLSRPIGTSFIKMRIHKGTTQVSLVDPKHKWVSFQSRTKPIELIHGLSEFLVTLQNNLSKVSNQLPEGQSLTIDFEGHQQNFITQISLHNPIKGIKNDQKLFQTKGSISINLRPDENLRISNGEKNISITDTSSIIKIISDNFPAPTSAAVERYYSNGYPFRRKFVNLDEFPDSRNLASKLFAEGAVLILPRESDVCKDNRAMKVYEDPLRICSYGVTPSGINIRDVLAREDLGEGNDASSILPANIQIFNKCLAAYGKRYGLTPQK